MADAKEDPAKVVTTLDALEEDDDFEEFETEGEEGFGEEEKKGRSRDRDGAASRNSWFRRECVYMEFRWMWSD